MMDALKGLTDEKKQKLANDWLLCYITGTVIGYMRSDDYSSLMDVLKGLTDVEKENLVNEVQGLVGSTTVEDLTTFIGSQAQREALINCIREFVKGIFRFSNGIHKAGSNTIGLEIEIFHFFAKLMSKTSYTHHEAISCGKGPLCHNAIACAKVNDQNCRKSFATFLLWL